MPALTPSDIARETFKQLMVRRLPPSPDNYRALYNEIAGVGEADLTAAVSTAPGTPAASFPSRELRALQLSLPRDTPAQQRLSRQLDQAIKAAQWEAFATPLAEFIKEQGAEKNWGELIAELLTQWEARHSGLTAARKRESLRHVLSSGAKAMLFPRLQGLLQSWSKGLDEANAAPSAEGEPETVVLGTTEATLAPSASPSRKEEFLPSLREALAYTLEVALPTQLGENAELNDTARALAAGARASSSEADAQDVLAGLKRLTYRLEFFAEDRNEVAAGLQHLLQLLVENASELLLDDVWLRGQLDTLREIVDRPPSVRTLNEAERRLKEVIFKQSQLKLSLVEAQAALKNLLARFVDHLVDFSDSTSDYQSKIERCAQKISAAPDLAQLEDVLRELVQETQLVQLNAQRSRDELRVAKVQVADAEKRIAELQEALDEASQQARYDPLSGAFNRQALEEAFLAECARARRRQTPLCFVMLAIDDFSEFHDAPDQASGELVGDLVSNAALRHLVEVLRAALRPQDTLARFAGDKFVVLLPETSVPEAHNVVVRLQRELTRRFFLHGNEKRLVTFSAGVGEVLPSDELAGALMSVAQRAADAQQQAQQSGKNQVFVG